MRFWFQLLLVSGIAVGLGGCDVLSGFLPGGGNEEDIATPVPVTPSEQVVPDPNAAVDPNAATNPDGTDPNAEDGTLPEAFEEPVIVGNVAGDLIQSTSPEERISLIQRDRPDPFEILQTTPSIELPEEEDIEFLPDADGDPIILGPDGVILPGEESIELPPEPATARAVAVTGVVQIGAVPYAIVNAPNEPHGRYVRSGQLLSNGQVLVKRIEIIPGVADPVVVLEEFGIEVSRPVGDNPDPSETAPDAPLSADEVDV